MEEDIIVLKSKRSLGLIFKDITIYHMNFSETQFVCGLQLINT